VVRRGATPTPCTEVDGPRYFVPALPTLRRTFGDEYEAYCRRVPRLIPRLTPADQSGAESEAGSFSLSLYLKHREYNALIGSLVVVAILIAKLLWTGR